MVSRKRNSVIYRFASLLLVLMLSACSALQGTPQPAPPVTDHPQEIRRDQTQGLQRIGTLLCVPMRLPVHNKLPAGSLGVYYRDGMPCNMWGNEKWS